MNWPIFERFFLSPDDPVHLIDGLMPDPRTDFGRGLNPTVATYDKLKPLGCVVLLGEPGIGKTESLRFIREVHKRAGERVAYVGLSCS